MQFGLGDLVVKYQRIMVKHMVINLTGTILQFESGFFICLGCAGLRIQKKVGKAVLSVKGQAVIASLGVWQNRDIKTPDVRRWRNTCPLRCCLPPSS